MLEGMMIKHKLGLYARGNLHLLQSMNRGGGSAVVWDDGLIIESTWCNKSVSCKNRRNCSTRSKRGQDRIKVLDASTILPSSPRDDTGSKQSKVISTMPLPTIALYIVETWGAVAGGLQRAILISV